MKDTSCSNTIEGFSHWRAIEMIAHSGRINRKPFKCFAIFSFFFRSEFVLLRVLFCPLASFAIKQDNTTNDYRFYIFLKRKILDHTKYTHQNFIKVRKLIAESWCCWMEQKMLSICLKIDSFFVSVSGWMKVDASCNQMCRKNIPN